MTWDTLATEELQEVESRRDRSIVIVDDDPGQCDALGYRFSKLGFRVHLANRGEEGLALIRHAEPDLILLDVRLPDADGFELCNQLADAPETSHIPVIIVSGTERPNAVRRAREVGSRYYLRKPYDPNALLLLVRDALGTNDW